MARIPVYQQQTTPSGLGPQVRAQGGVIAGTDLSGAAQALPGVAQDMIKVRDQKVEDDEITRAQSWLSEQRLYYTQDLNRRQNAWQPGMPGIYEEFSKTFKESTAPKLSEFKSPRVRNFLQGRLTDLETSFSSSAMQADDRNRALVADQSVGTSIKSSSDLLLIDPNQYDKVAAENRASIMATNQTYEWKLKQLERVGALAVAAEEGARANLGDDAYFYSRFKVSTAPDGQAPAPAGGFDVVISRILKDEGGYAARDGSSGSPVNFGINQGANPDIDVKNMTKDGAVKLYRERYWNKIDGDNLPASLQGTAMDAAVNQGPANAQKWIKGSGGDVARFNALRREHYEGLIASGKYSEADGRSWMRRLEHYEKGGGQHGPSLEFNGQKYEFSDGDAPLSFRQLDPAAKVRLFNQATQSMKQQQAVKTQAFVQRLQDSSAAAKDGIADAQPFGPSDFAILGDRAPAAYEEYTRTQQMARDVSLMNERNNQELVAVAAGDTREAQGGAGYAAADARDQVRQQAAKRVLEMRTKDPAGYVMKNTPRVQQAMEAAQNQAMEPSNRSAAIQAALDESMAAQRRLGIGSPRVLSEQQVQMLGSKLMQPNVAQDAALMADQLAAEYWRYYPQVLKELGAAKMLPSAMMVIPNLPNPGVKEAVAAAMNADIKNLKVGFAETEITDLNRNIPTQIKKFAASFPFAETHREQLNAYYEATQKLSLSLMRKGASPGEAAKKAGQMLWGQYEFYGDAEDDGVVRVPRGVSFGFMGSPIKAAKRKLSAELEASLDAFGLPPGGDAVMNARGKAESSRIYGQSIAANARFYSTDDDRGVKLFFMGMDGILRPVLRNGTEVVYSFDDLTK